MMHFYEIGYSDWESTSTYSLYHSVFYTQEQFDNLLCECYYESNKIEEIKHNKWISEDKDITEDDMDLYEYEPRVENLFTGVYNILLEKYGFSDLKFAATFVPNANRSILEEDVDYLSEEVKKIRNYFTHIGKRDEKINEIIQNEKPST